MCRRENGISTSNHPRDVGLLRQGFIAYIRSHIFLQLKLHCLFDHYMHCMSCFELHDHVLVILSEYKDSGVGLSEDLKKLLCC